MAKNSPVQLVRGLKNMVPLNAINPLIFQVLFLAFKLVDLQFVVILTYSKSLAVKILANHNWKFSANF